MASEQALKDGDRYRAAVHAMQTGVALMMNHNKRETEPKHIRVGINSALTDSSSLAMLLMQKGVITEEEYAKAIADGMEKEVERYKDAIENAIGIRPTLH